MAKLRTVEQLDDAISADIGWRKQELSTALKQVRQASGPAQKASLRAGVVLLYAHWEGWVKTVAQLYVRYVHTMAYPYDQLSTPFLGNALKTKMSIMDETTKPLLHNGFASFIRTELSSRAPLSEDLVRTEFNLSSNVLYDIVERLGLEKRELYVSRAPMIDNDLVHRRNTIAHGEFLDFETLRSNVLELLELFTDDVRNAASRGLHLAVPIPAA
jgi:hypothetical protein